MARVRTDNVFGTTSAILLVAGTTLNSAGLANLAVVAGSDRAVITLDPNRVNGAPEIVVVTAHTGAATSATITRGAEGTAAREHPSGTFWVHAATRRDFPNQMCRVFHSVNQSIADNTETSVAFDSERFDTDSMHDTVTNNSRITFNTAGVYEVKFNGRFATGATYDSIYATIRLNGATNIAIDSNTLGPAGAAVIAVGIDTLYEFVATDYVEVRVFQDNAANTARNLTVNANHSPEFSAFRVGTTV